MKNKIFRKILLLLFIAVNMPLNLLADAEQKTGGILDYSNGLIYDCTSDNWEELYVIHVRDTTIGILNIPSEVEWEDIYGYYRKSKVTSIHGIDYQTWNPYSVFYPLYLRCINIPETVVSIEEGVFKPYYLRRIWGGTDIYDDSHLAELMEINVDPDNPNFTSVDGVLYNKDKTVLIACPPARTECDIPASVTQVANYAFAGCRNMKSLTIPNTITQIGASAFEDCVNLQNITIPESVSTIGDHAFKDCKSLVAIDLPNSLDSIGEHMFENCKSLVSVKLPSSLTSLGNYSFMDCESLVSIDLPASLASIGDYVFQNCKSLASVDLPASLTSIGDYVFQNCKSLASVDLPASLTSIGYEIFSGCNRLKEIHVSPGNDRFADVNGILYDKNLSELLICPKGFAGECTIPSSVASIGESAFRDCVSLTSVNLPSSLTIIGESAFSGCISLTSVNLPSSLKEISKETFMDCSSLSDITLPDSLTKIKWKAFANCTSLPEITIPASVEYIGYAAFYNCTSLLTISSKRMTPPRADVDAFDGVPIIAYVYVPKRTVPLYLASKEWSRFYYYFEVEEWVTGISDIETDAATGPKDIYNMQGICIRRDATEADIDALPAGLYIIGGKKVHIK